MLFQISSIVSEEQVEQVLIICIDDFRVCVEHLNQLCCQLELKFHHRPINDGMLTIDSERVRSVMPTNFPHIISTININKFIPVLIFT